MAAQKPRRFADARQTAEAAFKSVIKKPVVSEGERPVIPGARELVSLRIDCEVLEYFQSGGPGWQDRLNDALRQLISK